MSPEEYARVKELFLEASALPGIFRRDFLDRTCSDAPEVRAEVESLLKHDRSGTIVGVDAPAIGSETVFDQAGKTLYQPRQLSTSGSRFLRTLGTTIGRRRRWTLGGLVLVLIFSGLGYWVLTGVRESLRVLRRENLEKLLAADMDTLRYWLEGEKAKVQSWTRDPDLVASVKGLVDVGAANSDRRTALLESPQQTEIRNVLRAIADPNVAYIIWDRSNTAIAESSPQGAWLGKGVAVEDASVLARVFRDETVVLPPHIPKTAGLESTEKPEISQRPVMAIAVPIYDEEGIAIASMFVHGIGTEETFFEIFKTVRMGDSGETYAFDSNGVMVSKSRFEKQLRRIGLMPTDPEATSCLSIQIRDPGGNLTTGFTTSTPLAARPLTKMAAMATAGERGVDVDGYRDYRGVLVVGAWDWLPEYGFGITTEIDYDEAYAPLKYLYIAFVVVLGLFAASAIGVVISAYAVFRLRNPVGREQRLGPYTLENLIGEGGMGSVYRARHAMLKRPTAVKLLKSSVADDTTIARFEREVQLASQLTHPNTIAIYDYGKTEEGVFYYAMEFLDGLNLAQLLKLTSPVPVGRVIFILKQVCESLHEAHQLGLVHRDIKPQNVMLCSRGGELDVVKVLDFGLVKHIDPSDAATVSTVLAGTPRYMAPERFLNPKAADPRSDIYSIGAVTYNLLTGSDIFPGDESTDILYHMVNTVPERPSLLIRSHLPADFDQLVIDCLAKDPDSRPSSVEELLRELAKVECGRPWTQADARKWWSDHADRVHAATPQATTADTVA